MSTTITLDIETIPDLAACTQAGVDPEEGFPPWPLHQLLCVSLLTHWRDADRRHHFDIETFSRADCGERGIVAEVEQRLSGAKQIVTYNGTGFDIPVLLARAAVTGERVPNLIRATQRSHAGFHCDLLDVVTANGAAVRPRLIDLCAGLGIPAKQELEGSSVAALARAGEFGRIGRYCEQDVTSTWLAAQMWTAVHDPDEAIASWTALADWIRTGQPRLAHLLGYCALPTMPGGGRALDAASVAAIRL